MKNINERLSEVFSRAFDDEVEINENLSKLNDERWDSINHLNLIVELEDEFGISLDETEIETINSVKMIKELLNPKI
jgi:acyl carrier protein